MKNRIDGLLLAPRKSRQDDQSTEEDSERSAIGSLNHKLAQVVTRYPLAVIGTGLLTGVVLGCLIKRR